MKSMQILVNGEDHEVMEGLSVADLVRQLELSGQRIAVEVDQELVPRSSFEEHKLTPGAHVEIVHAIGGG